MSILISMSFDLFFYTKADAPVSANDIRDYLEEKVAVPSTEAANQWWYENEDTEVYFSFDYAQPEISADPSEDMSFDGFENTGFSFNLNFMRPDFFGREAFPIVVKFMNELGLYVVNPQIGAASDLPHQPTVEALYDTWGKVNFDFSGNYFSEQCTYYPLEKSNQSWYHNVHRKVLQERLGDAYFVPRLFYFKPNNSQEVVTVASWTESIPSLLPEADYYLISRVRRKWFKKEWVHDFIRHDELMKILAAYIDPFDFPNTKIIHPTKALDAEKTFNAIKTDPALKDFAQRINVTTMFNNNKKTAESNN